jgi:NAD(P)H-flavin reductase
LDRILRLVRILWNNRRALSPSATDVKLPLAATADLLSPAMVRVTMKRNMCWKPGQSVLLTMPTVSAMPYEAHPFTICNIPRNTSLEEKLHGSKMSAKGENDLVFLIKVRNGFTKRLHDSVEQLRDVDGKAAFPVHIDGPYGSPPDVNVYEHVILIAGETSLPSGKDCKD